jgi:hypothetical protein
MFRFDPRKRLALLPVLLLACALLALAGCSDDDDGDDGNNPTDPGGGSDTFTQEVAVTQTQLAAPLAVNIVQDMPAFAQGFSGKDAGKNWDYDYGWNQDTQRWEASWNYDEGGYSYSWSYSVQYRDAMGDPVQEVGDAVSLQYMQDGDAGYDYDDGQGTAIVWSQLWDNDVTLTGLDTDSRVMQGSGGYDLDYTVTSGENTQSYDLSTLWETQGSGVVYPVDGCPSGTIRFFFDPYYMDVVFDGSSTASYTLYDGNGDEVPGGSGTEPLFCGR